MKCISRIILPCLLPLGTFGSLHAQWVPTNGPRIGPYFVSRTYSLVTMRDELGTDHLFAGCMQGLVYRTTDRGDHWSRTDGKPLSSSDTGFAYNDVVTLTLSRGYLFAGTIYHSSPSDAAGIFRCAIGDTHWVAVNNGLTNLNVGSLLEYIDESGDTSLFAGTGGGVFRTTNNGENWTPRNTGISDPRGGLWPL